MARSKTFCYIDVERSNEFKKKNLEIALLQNRHHRKKININMIYGHRELLIGIYYIILTEVTKISTFILTYAQNSVL